MRRNGIDVKWGQGDSSLFLHPVANGSFELLDYEFDHTYIHNLVGGRNFYQSRNGSSGAGFLDTMGILIPVGYYHTDTMNPWVVRKNVEGIEILIPYASHTANKSRLLQEYPVVLLIGENTIIYVSWYKNFLSVLKAILTRKFVETKTLSRTFIRTTEYGMGQKEEVTIQFANLFGYCKLYPWQWVTDNLLKDYKAGYSSEFPWRIFHVSQLNNGQLIKTNRIGGGLFATDLLQNDPCENVMEAPKGWGIAGPNMTYKVNDDEVYMLGWQLAKPLYEKRIGRLARFVPTTEREKFIAYCRENLKYGKYVEAELTESKLRFFLTMKEQIAEIRRNIAQKVRYDVMYVASRYVREEE